MKKMALSLTVLYYGFMAYSGNAIAAVDPEASLYQPILKLRTDNICWPTHPANGANSGRCLSQSEFNANPPAVYVEQYSEVYQGIEHKLFTYWFYYGHQASCISVFDGSHPDDWERITVHVSQNQLRHVVYHQHNGRYTLRAANAPLQNNRQPIVYVGKYAHGNYHDQRARCSFDGGCQISGDYCYYWKDPRGPGVDWQGALRPLSDISANAVFPGSTNPRQREATHLLPVCREDGGREIIFGIGIENTCLRNPAPINNPGVAIYQLIYQ